MSRMNAAWSNEPPWAEAVPAIFKEPMTIAFGGAILAHVIFFLGLPVVAGSEKQPDVQPVATTFLTDQEKSQIPPDLSQSQFSTGSLLPGSNSGLTMPPIPALPPTTGNIGTFPGSGFGFGQTNEPTFQSGGSTGSTSSSNDDYNARLETVKKQEEARREQIKKTELAQKQATEKAEDQKRSETPPGPLPTVPVGAMPPGTPSGETAKPAEGPAPTTPAPQPIRVSDKTLIDKDPALYAFVAENTGPSLGLKLNEAIGSWYKRDPKTEEIYSKSEGKQQLKQFPVDTKTGTIAYPRQIGKQDIAVIPGYAEKVKAGSAKERAQDYGTAIVGIATDRQGKFLIEPSVIQSTGHKVLDYYAIEYVKSRMFPVTGKDEFYMMIIPIDPPTSPQQATS